MKYTVIGKEYLDYVSKKTGKQVTGYNLYLSYEKDKCEGVATTTEFVNKEMGKDVEVSDQVELFYNKYGKVSQIGII